MTDTYTLYQIHPANGRVWKLTDELTCPLLTQVETHWLQRFEPGDIALVTANENDRSEALSRGHGSWRYKCGDVVWSKTVVERVEKALVG